MVEYSRGLERSEGLRLVVLASSMLETYTLLEFEQD